MSHSKANNNAAVILRSARGIVVSTKDRVLRYMFKSTLCYLTKRKHKVEER